MNWSGLDLTALVFPLILFSALTHAIYNALIKSAHDKLVARMLMANFSSLYLLPMAFLVPLPSDQVWMILGLTAFVHFAYQMAQITSLHHADFTFAYPVSRGSAPLVIAIAAPLILGDHVSLWQMAGIVVISGAILSMALSAKGKSSKGLVFSILTGLAIACYTLIDAKGVRLSPDPLTFIIWFFMLDSLVISTFTLTRHRQRFKDAVGIEWRRAAINGALGVCTFTSALLAFRYGNAPVMAAMRESSVLFAAGIGYLFLGETLGPRRLTAIAAILAGILIIRVA